VLLFAILGLASGSLYGLLGLGLIVVYRSSGVVNFSHGGIAIVAAYIYFDLRQANVNAPLSVILAVVGGAVLGFLIYALVIYQLRRASVLTQAIATLAVLIVLESWATVRYGSNPVIVPAFLSQTGVRLLGVTITLATVLTFCISVVLVAILAVIYQRTRFGMATTAVAEGEFNFSLLGRSSSAIAATNWVISGALAALAGVLIAPIVPISPTLGTTLLIPALAVALCGTFRSFGITLVGALLIGIAQSEITRYSVSGFLSNLTGLSEALPFIVIILVLILRSRALPTRDYVASRLPRVGSGATTPFWLAAWVILALILVFTLPFSWVTAVTTSVIAAILLLSVVVVSGYAGQLSLASVSVGGIGVLVASELVARLAWPMPLAALVGIGATLPVAFIVGLPALRTRGVILAVVTLGLADAINAMVFQRADLNANPLSVGYPKFFGVSLSELTDPRRYAIFAIILLILIGLFVSNLRRSSIGKLLIAVRGNERAAAALGIRVSAAKLYAFTLSGAIAAVAGIMAAWRVPFILFNSGYDPFTSVNAVVGSTLAGLGYISGAVLGGSITNPGSLGGTVINDIGLGQWLSLIAAGLLLINIVFNPDGIVPNTLAMVGRAAAGLSERTQRWRLQSGPLRWLSWRPAVDWSTGEHIAPRRGAAPGEVVLEIRDLTVVFGTTKAVSDVSLECRAGEIVGVIGANGSGKTTFIDAVTGYVRSTGQVLLSGRAIGALPAYRRNRLGVSRSFQSLELFEDLSVADNLLVATVRPSWWRWLTSLAWPSRPRPNDAVLSAVTEFGFTDVLEKKPSELPYGKRRLLAITRAIATEPRALLLDEPAAGLDEVDRQELRRVMRHLAEDWGMAILLIEHDVELIMDVCDRVMALDLGAKIAEGSPQEIRSHPEVVRAYLGEGEVAAEPAGQQAEAGASVEGIGPAN